MIVVISLYADEKINLRYCQFSMILGVTQIYVNKAKNI